MSTCVDPETGKIGENACANCKADYNARELAEQPVDNQVVQAFKTPPVAGLNRASRRKLDRDAKRNARKVMKKRVIGGVK